MILNNLNQSIGQRFYRDSGIGSDRDKNAAIQIVSNNRFYIWATPSVPHPVNIVEN